MSFVIIIDPLIIRKYLPSINHLSDGDIKEIFLHTFKESGLPSSQFSLKENMIHHCRNHKGTKLEIGPFDSPMLSGEGVHYFDILNQHELKLRAVEHNRNPNTVPEINYVQNKGDLSIIDKKFDLVLSSHCIEHTPDFVKHLAQVSNLLNSGGSYYLIIPDKRYCFDYELPLSTIADLIAAHSESQTKPPLAKLIEHRALLSHNNSIRHWLNDHDMAKHHQEVATQVKSATDEFSNFDGYIDVHCWRFTPLSLLEVLKTLKALNLMPFDSVSISLTPFGRKDFTAVFTR